MFCEFTYTTHTRKISFSGLVIQIAIVRLFATSVSKAVSYVYSLLTINPTVSNFGVLGRLVNLFKINQ
jgi:hypothetical protein